MKDCSGNFICIMFLEDGTFANNVFTVVILGLCSLLASFRLDSHLATLQPSLPDDSGHQPRFPSSLFLSHSGLSLSLSRNVVAILCLGRTVSLHASVSVPLKSDSKTCAEHKVVSLSA